MCGSATSTIVRGVTALCAEYDDQIYTGLTTQLRSSIIAVRCGCQQKLGATCFASTGCGQLERVPAAMSNDAARTGETDVLMHERCRTVVGGGHVGRSGRRSFYALLLRSPRPSTPHGSCGVWRPIGASLPMSRLTRLHHARRIACAIYPPTRGTSTPLDTTPA